MKKKNIIGILVGNLIIITATVVISLSSLSIAWFYNIKDPSANNAEVNIFVDPDSLSSSLELFKFNSDMNSGVKYGEEIGENNYTNHLDLNEFDNYIRERNVHNNNIIRFDMTFLGSYSADEYRDIKVTINALTHNQGDVFNSGDGKTNRIYNDEYGYKYTNSTDSKTYICNSISNVIYFKTLINKYTVEGTDYCYPNYNSNTSLINSNTDAGIYSQATEIFNNTAYGIEEKTFITSGTKTSEIVLTFNNIPGNVSRMELFVEYNYSIPLINAFNAASEQTPASLEEALHTSNVIQFQKDIENITITTSKQEDGYRS